MARTDVFLKIDGVDGESLDDKHKNEIEISSWSFQEQNSGTSAQGGGAGAGRVSMGDFHLTKVIDKSSPKIMQACATGKSFPKVLLTARKAGGEQQEYLKVTFTDVMISSFATSGTGENGVLPIENLALNFGSIKFEYSPQKADGSLDGAIAAGWDLKANKAI
jgi:type VI secretion system secreted protein Hcp